MKYIAATLLLAVSINCSAQYKYDEKRSEASISYGRDAFQEIYARGIGDHNYERSSSGDIFITYRYNFSRRVSLGLAAGLVLFNTESHEGSYSSGNLIATGKYKDYTAAMEFRLNYSTGEWYRTYTYLGAGYIYSQQQFAATPKYAAFVATSNTQKGYTMMYVPFGLSVGKTLCGFVEMGIGYKGLLMGGAAYRF